MILHTKFKSQMEIYSSQSKKGHLCHWHKARARCQRRQCGYSNSHPDKGKTRISNISLFLFTKFLVLMSRFNRKIRGVRSRCWTFTRKLVDDIIPLLTKRKWKIIEEKMNENPTRKVRLWKLQKNIKEKCRLLVWYIKSKSTYSTRH